MLAFSPVDFAMALRP